MLSSVNHTNSEGYHACFNDYSPPSNCPVVKRVELMEFHPVADIFPMMTPDELETLRLDIAANGQREPILVANGQIADGRNRYRACIANEIEPSYRYWDGVGDLTAIVVSLNLKRRHLSPSQLSMVAAKLATMRQGERNDLSEISGKLSQTSAAKLLNISADSVGFAKKVQRDGDPELIEAVESGEIKVSTAAEIATLSKPEQKRLVEQVKKIKKAGRKSSKKVLLGLKTQSLRQTAKGYGTCLYCNPEAEWTDAAVSAFAQRVEQRGKEAQKAGRADKNFAAYFESIAIDIEDEIRSASVQHNYDKIFAAIDAGADIDNRNRQCAEKTDIQRITGIPWPEFNDTIAHMLDYGMIEAVKQGGKTEGARGARKILFRRVEKQTGDLDFEIDEDFPEKDIYYDPWE